MFAYNFEGYDLLSSTSYSLIYYADGWPGNHPGALIGQGTTDLSGNLSLSGNPDLSIDLPDPADANYASGAKIWLVPSGNYNIGTKSVTVWNPAQFLFETDWVHYDDTDTP